MATTKLVTRCPACRTAFRLVADQLRLRQGLVRCGRCDTVFDAREHMVVVELPQAAGGASAPAPAPVSAPASVSLSAPEPAPVSAPAAAAVSAAIPEAAAEPAHTETPPGPTFSAPFDPGYDPGYDVPALDTPTMVMVDADAAAPSTTGTLKADEVVFETDVATIEEAPSSPSAQPAPPWPELDQAALEANAPRTIWAAPPAPSGGMRIEPSLRAAGEYDAEAQDRTHHAATEAAEDVVDIAPANGPDEAPPAPQARTHDFSDAVASEQVTRRWTREEPAAGPIFEPDFLRQARERERTRARQASAAPEAPRSNRRTWLLAALGVLLVAALLQGTYLARSQLAGRFPVLRPMLESACVPLGCAVPPWRDLDALRIESSQLQRQQEGSDEYILAVTVRNNGRALTALPAIELVMTDLQDQLMLRRVLLPADYLEASQRDFAIDGLPAGTELPLRVAFRTQQAAANYRVLLFYP